MQNIFDDRHQKTFFANFSAIIGINFLHRYARTKYLFYGLTYRFTIIGALVRFLVIPG
jgi:hypothetical protein